MASQSAQRPPIGFYCRSCDAARYFEDVQNPDWIFCPECGTQMTDADSRPKYAGFWVRLGGFAIDQAIFAVPYALLFALSLGIAGELAGLLSYGVLLISLGNEIVGNARGATVGKWAVGLRIVDQDGNRPGYKRSLLRYVVSLFSGLVLAWGYWRMLFSEKKQTLHDDAANTYVVAR